MELCSELYKVFTHTIFSPDEAFRKVHQGDPEVTFIVPDLMDHIPRLDQNHVATLKSSCHLLATRHAEYRLPAFKIPDHEHHRPDTLCVVIVPVSPTDPIHNDAHRAVKRWANGANRLHMRGLPDHLVSQFHHFAV